MVGTLYGNRSRLFPRLDIDSHGLKAVHGGEHVGASGEAGNLGLASGQGVQDKGAVGDGLIARHREGATQECWATDWLLQD